MRRGARIALGLCAALLGCAAQETAGSSSETENMVAARELSVDSLLDGRGSVGGPGTVATIRLDSSNFDFSRSTASGEDVSVERLDGRLLPFRAVFWDSSARCGRLEVRLDSLLAAGGGRIVLRWGLSRAVRAVAASVVWRAIPDSQRLALTSFLVDDFESGKVVSLLPRGGMWYASLRDSGTITSPAYVEAGLGRAGTVLHAAYDSLGFRFVGLVLGGAHNLRSLDSLVFWARGTGRLFPALENLQAGTAGKAWTRVQLDSTAWVRVRIRPEDFDSANGLGGNIGWAKVRDRVTNLTILFDGGHDVYLDDVRLYGVGAGDLK